MVGRRPLASTQAPGAGKRQHAGGARRPPQSAQTQIPKDADLSRDPLAPSSSDHRARRYKNAANDLGGATDNHDKDVDDPDASDASIHMPRKRRPGASSQPVRSAQSVPRTKPGVATQPSKPSVAQPRPSTMFAQPLGSTSSSQPARQSRAGATPSGTPRPSASSLRTPASTKRNKDLVTTTVPTMERNKSDSSNTMQHSSAGPSQRPSQSSTLGFSSAGPSPQVSQARHETLKRKKGVPLSATSTAASTTTNQINEADAWSALNVYMRRYYLAFLSNTFVDEPVMAVLPGMRRDHETYKTFRAKAQSQYKQWKSAILLAAAQWVERWLSQKPAQENQRLSAIKNFRVFKDEIRHEYENEWAEDVFKFAVEAVDFENITPAGHRFLQHAFTTLAAKQRMYKLHMSDLTDISVVKYTRKYILDSFDALHTHPTCVHQTIKNFPERSVPRAISNRKRTKLVPVLDSDATDMDDESDSMEASTRRASTSNVKGKGKAPVAPMNQEAAQLSAEDSEPLAEIQDILDDDDDGDIEFGHHAEHDLTDGLESGPDEIDVDSNEDDGALHTDMGDAEG